ncbi:unnamed protein product, partial [marine sediment metagenome]
MLLVQLINYNRKNAAMKKLLLIFFILTVLPTLLIAQTLTDSPKYQKARKKMVLLHIEIKEKLYKNAESLLRSIGFSKIKTRHGDGYFGWPEAAPFDCIMITASIDHIPPPLSYQYLSLVTKHD